MEAVGSCLAANKRGLSRLILEAVGSEMATTDLKLLDYMQSTLLFVQNKKEDN